MMHLIQSKRVLSGIGVTLSVAVLLVAFQNCSDHKIALSEREPEYLAVTDGSCGSRGITQAKLLTTSVVNGSTSSFMEYEIAHSDCEGFALSLANRPILFDVDGFIGNGGLNVVTYVIVSESSELLEGKFESVQGSDLFGNVGSNKFHFKTKNLSFSSETFKVRLKVKLNGTTWASNGEDLTNGLKASYDLNTYLKFGDASEVVKKVRFTRP